MDKKTKEKIFSKREAVKYSASRAYFGKLTGANLSSAFAQFKHTQDWDRPITSANVTIGKIDGDVICHALWHEMSYNPARFGKVSPFRLERHDAIYRFCDTPVSQDVPAFEIIEKIRHKLIGFMTINGRNSGKWIDVIPTTNDKVTIHLVDGHSDDNYKSLALLQEMIRIIAHQNLQDFNKKNYRNQMLNIIAKRHPNGVRGDAVGVIQQKAVQTPMRPSTPEEIAEDRIDNAIDNAQITLDNRKYVSSRQYRQARADITGYMAEADSNAR